MLSSTPSPSLPPMVQIQKQSKTPQKKQPKAGSNPFATNAPYLWICSNPYVLAEPHPFQTIIIQVHRAPSSGHELVEKGECPVRLYESPQLAFVSLGWMLFRFGFCLQYLSIGPIVGMEGLKLGKCLCGLPVSEGEIQNCPQELDHSWFHRSLKATRLHWIKHLAGGFSSKDLQVRSYSLHAVSSFHKQLLLM